MKKRIPVDAPGMRLDLFLVRHIEKYSRTHLKGLIERGFVTVGGAARKADYRLQEGESVEVTWPEAAWEEGTGFEDWVLHEDKHLLVLRKPAGLLMHPLGESWLSVPEAAMAETQANLAGLLQRRRPGIVKAGVPRCGIVHRLDRQTSGVLLVAKTPKTYEALVGDFKRRKISKLYRAVVRGVPKSRTTRVQAPIGRLPGHRRVVVTQFGKDAETAFAVVETARDAALIEARPLTGRTHQIRAHLGLMGHPVMGDIEFDKKQEGRPWPSRMLLHAFKIEFTHPGTGQRTSFTAPPPEDFRDFWAALKRGAKK